MLNVEYLDNCGYTVETESDIYVFDYVTKEGKIFERKQLNISEAYSNLEDVFSIINDDLDTFFKNNNLSILDWSRRKDILLKFVEE